MKENIEVGDFVSFVINGIIKKSKIFRISQNGLFAFVDYYEGDDMIAHKESPIEINKIILIAKAKKLVFTCKEIVSYLKYASYK